MTKAWETTVADVQRVIRKNTVLVNNIISIEALSAQMLDQLNHDAICKAALYGLGMDDQAEYADDCIEEQLLGLGVITINGPTEVIQ